MQQPHHTGTGRVRESRLALHRRARRHGRARLHLAVMLTSWCSSPRARSTRTTRRRRRPSPRELTAPSSWVANVIVFVGLFIYYVVLEAIFSASVGKPVFSHARHHARRLAAHRRAVVVRNLVRIPEACCSIFRPASPVREPAPPAPRRPRGAHRRRAATLGGGRGRRPGRAPAAGHRSATLRRRAGAARALGAGPARRPRSAPPAASGGPRPRRCAHATQDGGAGRARRASNYLHFSERELAAAETEHGGAPTPRVT